MKNLLGKDILGKGLVISILVALSLLLCAATSIHAQTLNRSDFHITRGVNLSHWLSQDFGWEEKYAHIQKEDIKFIKSIGYDHVRIPIDEIEMWDSLGNQNELAFWHLTQCLDWCAKYNLRAIVDLHVIRSHHFNAANEGGDNSLWADSVAQENLINMWVQLSERLKKYPNDMVAYEILNEAVAPDHEDWNKLLNRAISTLRKLEPERVLVVGPNMWQVAVYMKFLEIPEGDKNIILSFHTYAPMAFTHYKADWTPMKDYHGMVHYPGQVITDEDYTQFVDTTNEALVKQVAESREVFNRERLLKVFETAIEYAKDKNLQLYCGEFGCLPTVAREDRLAYYKDIVSVFEENNIAWCNWEYKGDFGIYFFDQKNKVSLKPDDELINILLEGR